MTLSLFRIACAFTVMAHVIPSLILLDENYLGDAFVRYNLSFFPKYIVEWVVMSPDWVVYAFAWSFCIFSLMFLVGWLSQVSAIMTLVCCYFFYAYNSFHVGTLSWDILLVTLFLMSLVPYHGDFFSIDSLRKRGEGYRQKRPFFLQRMLQLQIGFTFFYTALWKIFPSGNWLSQNPIYYLMHKPPAGVTKWFLLRDYLKTQPELCYWIGISIIVVELFMIMFLFLRWTRVSAIYLGIIFHVILILTLDVPATFFFLFPAQLILFINPDKIVSWINERRQVNESASRSIIFFDGQCGFCLRSVERLQMMDVTARYQYQDFRKVPDLSQKHPSLSKDRCERELIIVDRQGRLTGGFFAFRQMSTIIPLMWPFILVFYFPGMGLLGPLFYRIVAQNRRMISAIRMG